VMTFKDYPSYLITKHKMKKPVIERISFVYEISSENDEESNEDQHSQISEDDSITTAEVKGQTLLSNTKAHTVISENSGDSSDTDGQSFKYSSTISHDQTGSVIINTARRSRSWNLSSTPNDVDDNEQDQEFEKGDSLKKVTTGRLDEFGAFSRFPTFRGFNELMAKLEVEPRQPQQSLEQQQQQQSPRMFATPPVSRKVTPHGPQTLPVPPTSPRKPSS